MSESRLDKQVFSSQYPVSDAVVVPEYFRDQTIEGLPPNECVYPMANVLVRDIEDRTLYLKTKSPFVPEDRSPDYLTGRVGVMKVCRLVGDEVVTFYVADMRCTSPSDLSDDFLNTRSAQDESTRDYRQTTVEHTGAVRVAAAVFSDPEGSPHFFGDLSLQSHVQALMESTDEIIEGMSRDDYFGHSTESAAGSVALTQLTDNTWRIAW